MRCSFLSRTHTSSAGGTWWLHAPNTRSGTARQRWQLSSQALLVLLAGSSPTALQGSTQLLQQLAGGCCGTPPSLHSRKQLAGLFEPVALPEAHSNSAELGSGPSGTMVTLNPLGGLCLFWWHGVLPGPPTSGIGSKQVSHSPETVVGIQGPFLSLASQHRALQSMWG